MIRHLFLTLTLYILPLKALVLESLTQTGKLEETLSGKKVGFYVGSFDPIHKGHEALAQKVIDQGFCDYVLMYPAWGGDTYKKRADINIAKK